MVKVVTAWSAVVVAAWALAASAGTADAGHRHRGCCGPIPPSYTYHTKKVHQHVTHHRDVWRTRYVKRVKPIVHVTRVQPVVHVHNVTRVHTRIVGVVHPVHHRVTQWLPPRHYYTSGVIHLRPHCACSHRPYYY